jgi:uracil-DNA glycosylase
MRVSQCIECTTFPCVDVNKDSYTIPTVDLDPDVIRIVLISEASPADLGDHYYASGDPLFQQTTVQAFQDAGADVHSIGDIIIHGIYLTTAIKCGKIGYLIKAGAIKECSHLLEAELDLFPNIKVILLMGDVAIKALNTISKRKGLGRVIPAGSTYKIRGADYVYGDVRVYPSYVQAGPSFFIEKSKRRMIAEDIASALAYCEGIKFG